MSIIQVEPNHYFDISYDSKERMISYWYQINEIRSLNTKNVLEVGLGNGFLSNYLKVRKINVVTIDIDKRLNPDISSSVVNLPFINEIFDTVVSFEVLEHIPYDDAKLALSEMFRVSRKYVILSIPDCTHICRFSIPIPKMGMLNRLVPLPHRPKQNIFNGEHYWEIGKRDFPLSRLVNDIKDIGFEVISTYRIFENPYHRFFILKKLKEN